MWEKRRVGKWRGELTDDGGYGVQVIWITLPQNKGYRIRGPRRWIPSNSKRLSGLNSCRHRSHGEGILSRNQRGHKGEEECGALHLVLSSVASFSLLLFPFFLPIFLPVVQLIQIEKNAKR
jgi:hypothetical protein